MVQKTGVPLVAVAGNPNTGKTTLFNRLTGSRAKVGNYPGITVDRQSGRLELEPIGDVEILDVPGTYSLAARSEEENLAIQAIAGLHPLERPNAVVCVVDATQLTRNLYLVLQVIEIGIPVVIALNMVDMLAETGQEVDAAALERELGVPVAPIVASKGDGLDELKRRLAEVLGDPDRGRAAWSWRPEDDALAGDLVAVAESIPEAWHAGHHRRRDALALWALLSIGEDDELRGIPVELRERVRGVHRAAHEQGRDLDDEIITARYAWIDRAAPEFVHHQPVAKLSWTDRVDRILLHPVAGFALFLIVMAIVFQSLFAWADPAISLIEYVVNGTGDFVASALPAGIFSDLIVKGVIQGVGAVVVFLPQILLIFFFLGVMEDTGYMARVAFLMDRVMKVIGLHGRAFVPMLSGYACAIPAIMATRTMERKRDRMLTMMVVPLMTCSARLPVYALLIAALAPPGEDRLYSQGLLMVGMYLFSTLTALVAAAVLGRTVFRGPRVPLILAMPPYRMPHWPSILRVMWRKGRVFLREAGTVILFFTIVMWALLEFPRQAEPSEELAAERATIEALVPTDAAEVALRDKQLAAISAEEAGARLRNSYAGRLGNLLEPALEPLGFDWKIGIGLIGAFAAREVYVSTMAVVYGLDAKTDEKSSALRDRLREQRWPDGRKVYTPLVSFTLMVFFALACQCMSTLAVVKRETGSYRWPLFLFTYMTTLAWLASFAIYQGGKLLGFE